MHCGIDPMNHWFRARFVGLVDVWKYFLSGYGNLFPAGAVELHEPQPISDQSVGFGVSIPCGAVSTRGTTVFVPGSLEL